LGIALIGEKGKVCIIIGPPVEARSEVGVGHDKVRKSCTHRLKQRVKRGVDRKRQNGATYSGSSWQKTRPSVRGRRKQE